MKLMEITIASTPPAKTLAWPGSAIKSVSKKRRKKWRRSSKQAEWVSASQRLSLRRMAVDSTSHGRDQTADHACGVFLIRQLREDAFQRRLAEQAAQALHAIMRDGFALAQN